ncbi:hypothetical protein [Flavobacterium sp.]
MKSKNLLTLLILFLFIATSFAQKSNAKSIIGCWVLKSMEYSKPLPDKLKLSDDAMNSTVCFDADGKFITQLGGENPLTVKGNYTLSADGKILSQSREVKDQDVDEEAEITQLDEKKLAMKLEFGTMIFERK